MIETAERTRLDTEAIAAEFQRILHEHGHLTAEILVAEAEDPESPLHPYIYELDESRAAYQYRCERARWLIRHVKVNVIEGDSVSAVRAFVNVKTDEGSEYLPREKVLSDPDLSEQRRRYLLSRLANIQTELRHMSPTAAIHVEQAVLELEAVA